MLSFRRPPRHSSRTSGGQNSMKDSNWVPSRRWMLKAVGVGIGASVARHFLDSPRASAQIPAGPKRVPDFTGPEANTHWNSLGAIVTEPQKAPLILLTDRPVQLETHRHYFRTAFTPNEAFFVRWHLEGLPNSIDLREWRLRVEGNVEKPLTLSFHDLLTR